MGVATVGLLYAAVKRVAGPGAGLLAGAALALTPVAVLIFRFNNPDALLVLVLVGAAYATQRAVEKGGTRWLRAGRGARRRRLPHQDAAGLPRAAGARRRSACSPRPSAGGRGSGTCWSRASRCWSARAGGCSSWSCGPPTRRPYIGGSQTNSVLELVFGYNGFGRLTGDETGSVGGSAAAAAVGQTGITRMFGSEIGGQVVWLLPAALVLLGVLVWRTRRRARDGRRCAPPLRALGRLAAGHRADLQLHGRDHPPVLHGGARAGDRRAGRHRGDGSCGATAPR